MRRFVRWIPPELALFAFAVACREPVFAVRDIRVTLVSASEWAGGEIVLTSPSFCGADTLPLVLAGGDTLKARFAAPDTVFAAAPAALGTHTVTVQFASGGQVVAGEVHVAAGFTGYWQGPRVWGHPIVWPVPGEPRFVADGATHLLLIDPAARTSEDYLADSLHVPGCMHGPGFDVDGSLVLVRRNPPGGTPYWPCGPLYAYREVAGQLVVVDSGPPSPDWHAVRLGGGDWIWQTKHRAQRWIRDGSGAVRTMDHSVEQPYGYAVSAVGGRAVPLNAGGDGIPIFARGSLAPQYYIPGFFESQGAVFSLDGDTLFFAGTPSDSASQRLGYFVAAAWAADGSVLRSARNDLWVDDFLLDPNGRWIYAVGTWGPRGPILQVLDRASLRVVARMQPPAGAIPDPSVFPRYATHFTPILSAADRTLYVVAMYSYGTSFGTYPLEVCSFKLLD